MCWLLFLPCAASFSSAELKASVHVVWQWIIPSSPFPSTPGFPCDSHLVSRSIVLYLLARGSGSGRSTRLQPGNFPWNFFCSHEDRGSSPPPSCTESTEDNKDVKKWKMKDLQAMRTGAHTHTGEGERKAAGRKEQRMTDCSDCVSS